MPIAVRRRNVISLLNMIHASFFVLHNVVAYVLLRE
jgi:hypothetical protein